MITKLNNKEGTIQIGFRNKTFELEYSNTIHSFSITDTTIYNFDEIKQILNKNNECFLISSNMFVYDDILIYNGDSLDKPLLCSYDDEIPNIGFESIDIYVEYGSIFLYRPNKTILVYNENGTIIKNKELMNIINELTENEKEKLIRIFRQFNSLWHHVSYINNEPYREYKLIFEPDN